MDKRANFIDENKDFLLKNFCYFSEVSDVTESKNGTLFFSFNHGVHISFCYYVRSNNLGSSRPKDCGEKGSNFDDSVADDSSLELNIGIEVFFCSRFWVFGHEHEFFHHIFYGLDEKSVDTLGEHMHDDEESDADEKCFSD